MSNKVVFLCTDPRESFLSFASQSHTKAYYEWTKKVFALKNIKAECREYHELYGEIEEDCEQLFQDEKGQLLLLYVQSDRQTLIEKIFQSGNLVIMGLPGSRTEFEKIFMTIVPWKNKVMFLWGNHIGRDESYIKKLSRDCMIREEQFVQFEVWKRNLNIKKLPLFCGSL